MDETYFNNPLFLIPLITGVTFLVAGLVMIKFPPKKINFFYGYRSSSSMKSQERWDFAQKHSAKELIKLGSILILISIAGLIVIPESSISTLIGITAMLLAAVLLVINTERAIKNTFKGKK